MLKNKILFLFILLFVVIRVANATSNTVAHPILYTLIAKAGWDLALDQYPISAENATVDPPSCDKNSNCTFRIKMFPNSTAVLDLEYQSLGGVLRLACQVLIHNTGNKFSLSIGLVNLQSPIDCYISQQSGKQILAIKDGASK